MQAVYIYDAVRTPRAIAKDHGALHRLSPLELLKQLSVALQQRTGLDPADLDDVVLGCVSQFGEQAGNIARAAVINAGWPDHVPGMTVARFCSSSLDAACVAFDRIAAGSNQLIVAGGVESMSRVPMQSDQPQWMMDFSPHNATRWIPIGICADLIATQQGYSRKDLDNFALQSQQRAQYASEAGHFDRSLIPMRLPDGGTFNRDETIRGDTTLDKLASLPPAFAELGENVFDERLLILHPQLKCIDHQHTVGNAPRMADAASLLLIGDQSFGNNSSITARAQMLGHCSYCGPVEQGLTGGARAARKLLDRHNIKAADLDLVEFNESFAGPTLKFIEDLKLTADKVNVNGGAIALGHPMGATGGNLTGMLLDELERRDQELGMVVICGATGSGTAMLVRRC
ncbi:MAG: acetyl-CoA C-acyltransferase [Arenicella sp.]|nr:acetyl-CoA C-acyltransferase [Arenicella sp.]